MKITRVSSVVYRQHIKSTGPKLKFGGEARDAFETLLVKVETDGGITGWGEAFPHRVWPAIKILLDDMIGPACVGADVADLPALMNMLAYRYHNVGRAGPVMYALSGIDIALWDIAGKVANEPIYKLLGGTARATVPAYASLLRYGDVKVVERLCEDALGRGYKDVKIHEIGEKEIVAAAGVLKRHNAGPLMVDVNAPWTLQEALSAVAPLRRLGLKWVEEPVWPPEDFLAANEVSRRGVPVAIGENVLSLTDFKRLIESRAVDFVQPSVTKIGGISATRDIFAFANNAGMAVAPHSAYFGPGLIATAHLIAALSPAPMLERLYCDLTESPFGDWYEPRGGSIDVPQGPGLGIEPDSKILKRLRVN
jgi:D-galactarolactone cycloisomerase